MVLGLPVVVGVVVGVVVVVVVVRVSSLLQKSCLQQVFETLSASAQNYNLYGKFLTTDQRYFHNGIWCKFSINNFHKQVFDKFRIFLNTQQKKECVKMISFVINDDINWISKIPHNNHCTYLHLFKSSHFLQNLLPVIFHDGVLIHKSINCPWK